MSTRSVGWMARTWGAWMFPFGLAAATPGAVADSGQYLGIAAGATAGASLAPGGATVEGRYLYELADAQLFEGRARFVYGGAGEACADRECGQGPLAGRATQLDLGIRFDLADEGAVIPWFRPSIGLRWTRYVNADATGVALPVGLTIGAIVPFGASIRLTGSMGIDVGYAWHGGNASSGVAYSVAALGGVEFSLR